jgi:imidazolonepropionase-like amidohydrolase
MAAPRTETLVLRNLTLIDGTGADPVENAAVIVEGERIKEVLPAPPKSLPASATALDCRGQRLLPGLIDGHVHMGAIEANLSEQRRRLFSSTLVIGAVRIIKETLNQGFTSARDVGGIDPGFRQAVQQGLIPGPRLFVSGRSLTQTGGHGDPRLPTEYHTRGDLPVVMNGLLCDGVDAVRWGAREQLRQGVDLIKVMAGGGAMSPSDEIDTSQYSLDELKAAVWEAESVGKYVAAHCYSDRSILNSLAAGIRTIEHGNLLTEKAARAIKEAGAYLVPTIVAYEMMSQMGPSLGVPEDNIRKINEAKEKAFAALTIAKAVGCTIASGSDLLGPMQVYKGVELELKARVLGPMGAIVATTKTNAEMLRQVKNLGTVEAGKLADLILVDGDPLKDITLFQKYQEKITLIMQGGKLYKNILS